MKLLKILLVSMFLMSVVACGDDSTTPDASTSPDSGGAPDSGPPDAGP